MTVFLAGTIPVIWLALKIALYWKGNLFTVFRQMDEIFAQPLHIAWTEDSLRDVFFMSAGVCHGDLPLAFVQEELPAGRGARFR